MKKISIIVNLIIFAFLLAFLPLKSQSLQPTNGNLIVVGSDTATMTVYGNVRNISFSQKPVKVKFKIINLVAGSDVSICFGTSCYPPKTSDWEMPDNDADNLKSLDTSLNRLLIDFNPNNVKGHSTVQFIFEVVGNPKDTASFFVDFYADTLVDVVSERQISAIVSLFPNPAMLSVNLNIQGLNDFADLKFNLYSLSGQLLKNYRVSSGLNSIGINDFPDGGYYYNITENGKPVESPHRFIIAR